MANLSEEVNIIVISSAFFLLVAVGIVVLVLVYQKKQSQYMQEKAVLQAAFEKELLEAQLQIQEQTLKNIAQEIHDNIGQTLSLAKLNLNTISPEKAAALPQKLANTKELVSKAITDLRILSKTLHTEAVLSLSLPDAIGMELKLIEKAGEIETGLEISGIPLTIDKQKELILFRVVQEALNNAIKHSGAAKIIVQLFYTPQELQVVVKDNGKGFPVQAEHGSGLRNMRNRAKLIGGHFQIVAQQPGTQIKLNLPIIAA